MVGLLKHHSACVINFLYWMNNLTWNRQIGYSHLKEYAKIEGSILLHAVLSSNCPYSQDRYIALIYIYTDDDVSIASPP